MTHRDPLVRVSILLSEHVAGKEPILFHYGRRGIRLSAKASVRRAMELLDPAHVVLAHVSMPNGELRFLRRNYGVSAGPIIFAALVP